MFIIFSNYTRFLKPLSYYVEQRLAVFFESAIEFLNVAV